MENDGMSLFHFTGDETGLNVEPEFDACGWKDSLWRSKRAAEKFLDEKGFRWLHTHKGIWCLSAQNEEITFNS